MNWRKEKFLEVGDLVYHVLYGRDWMGVVLGFERKEEESRNRTKVIIHMVPGSRYENFFSKRPKGARRGTRSGIVGENWLVKIRSDIVKK